MNNRRTHADSHIIDLGGREARRQGVDIDTLPLTAVEDLGFVMQRRRRVAAVVAGTLTATLAVVGFNVLSDNYDTKYEDCPVGQQVSWHFDVDAGLYAASVAAEAGCDRL